MRSRWVMAGVLVSAVALVGLTPLSAQPPRPGGSADTVKKLEAELAELKEKVKGVEERLAAEKAKAESGKGKGKGFRGGPPGKRDRDKGEKKEEKKAPEKAEKKGEKRGFGGFGGFGKGSFGKGRFGGAPKAEKKSEPATDKDKEIEKKLDQIQRDLEELKRALRKR